MTTSTTGTSSPGSQPITQTTAPPTGATTAPEPLASPVSPATTRPSAAELEALTAAVQAEQAALYGYGIVGGQVRPARRTLVRQRLTWHAARRDELAAQLSAAGHKVPAGPAAYDLPFAVNSDSSARRLAGHLEQGVAAAWADLVAATTGTARITAAQALSSCASAAWGWGAAPLAFPGLPERSAESPA